MSEQHDALRAALSRFYKEERDRAQQCLGDIVVILQHDTAPDSELTERILDRLIKHFDGK